MKYLIHDKQDDTFHAGDGGWSNTKEMAEAYPSLELAVKKMGELDPWRSCGLHVMSEFDEDELKDFEAYCRSLTNDQLNGVIEKELGLFYSASDSRQHKQAADVAVRMRDQRERGPVLV